MSSVAAQDQSTPDTAPDTASDTAPFARFLGPSSFWYPEHVVESAWLEHAPFAFWLVAAARPRVLVELGTHRGYSYLAFCQAVQRLGLNTRCHAVDHWTGDKHAGQYGDEVFQALRAYHEPRYSSFSTLLRMPFDAALDHVADGSVDLLHIDGQHEYADVRHDFEAWRPKLSGRGVVLFHDVNVRYGTFGVARFWEEMRREYPGFAFQHGFGLGVLGVGADLPSALAALFAATRDPATAAAVSQAYARLGSAITAQAGVDGQAGLRDRLGQLEADLQARIAAAQAGADKQAQLLTRLRAELVSAKAAEGRAQAAVARLRTETADLREENAKRDEVIRIVQGDAAGVREVLATVQRDQTNQLADQAAAHGRDLDALRDEQAAWEDRHAALQHEADQLRAGNAHRDAEIIAKNAQLHEAGQAQQAALAQAQRHSAEVAALRGSAAWRLSAPLRALGLAGETATDPYRGVMGRLRLLKHGPILARSPLFDRAWYLRANPDVAAASLDPVHHYLRHAVRDGRDPGPAFSTAEYLARRPDVAAARLNPLLHHLTVGQSEPAPILAEAAPPALAYAPPQAPSAGSPAPRQAEATVPDGFRDLEAYPVYSIPARARPRICLVTDSLNADSLYGGVATGLVLAAILAQRAGADLRILTRAPVVDPGCVEAVLAGNGVAWDGNVDLVAAPLGRAGTQIDVAENDLFLTTSWWTTWSMLRSVGPGRLLYLLQEDERLFYPHNDLRLRCDELLNERGVRLVVNSRLLYDHLAATGVADLAARATWFEPAVPIEAAPLGSTPTGDRPAGKRNFFFYARPNHARNLFLRGTEALAAAIEDGHLDPDAWTIHCVGSATPIELPRGVRPVMVPTVPRAEYVALLRRMDAGLCLMYTPHPSYPPLDLAAAGAVVVTNRYANKVSLSDYSPNILCAELDVASLSAAIGEATALAADEPRRRANAERAGLQRDWRVALAGVVDRLGMP